ncbi:ParB/RepB/Spo0J family partition protein [Rubripirellula amarantea]|nr:ParB/RepB/Spo0J family partition protein [Rubripirellula amarantea]
MHYTTTKPQSYRTVRKRVTSLKPSPENERLYRKVTGDDPEIQKLADSIEKSGLHEPLVITADNFIVSGHRRYAALCIIGQKQAPCRVLTVTRAGMDRDAYIALLRDHNRQRSKSAAEDIRESLIDVDPEEAAANLRIRRHESQQRHLMTGVGEFTLDGTKRRHAISAQKSEHVEHIKKVVFGDRREYWPLADRSIHYALLNYTFLRNVPRKIAYTNDDPDYNKTCDLLVRLRFNGVIPWEAITDTTRPTTSYRAFGDVRQFIDYESNQFLSGYWRNLLQSQPNHVEVLVEKNTVKHMADMVCEKYQMQTTSARGFNSVDSLYEISKRYHTSGKDSLRLIMLADFDPEGERLTNNAGITLRDEFGVEDVKVFKCGVTPEQIVKYNLPTMNFAKEESKNLKWFLERTGGNSAVYELESLKPKVMMDDLEECIKGVIDLDLYNEEVAKEQEEAVELERVHRIAQEVLRDLI